MLKHGVATKRTILAMILTGFSRSIVNVQCLACSGTAHVKQSFDLDCESVPQFSL